jgi:hypothetical protein
MKHIKNFNEDNSQTNTQEQMKQLEDKIIDLLDEAGEKLSKDDFGILAESIMDYIDDIIFSKYIIVINDE